MSLSPIIRINVSEVHFYKTTDKTEFLCYITLEVYICCVFYALVKFKHKKHVVRVRKTSWVGLK